MLPGWYGVGQALAAFEDKGLLREMVEAWPFFRTTLDNLEMVLAKSDMDDRRALCRAGRGRGPARARSSAASATAGTRPATPARRSPARRGCSRSNPALDASIRLRLPYIEPLNLLQIELLKRHRAGEDDPRIARRHPAVDQRHRDGPAQFGLIS